MTAKIVIEIGGDAAESVANAMYTHIVDGGLSDSLIENAEQQINGVTVNPDGVDNEDREVYFTATMFSS